MRLKEKEAQNACKEGKAYFPTLYKMFNYLGYKKDVYSRIKKNPLRGKKWLS